MPIISGSLEFKAARVKKLTLDGDDELRDHWEDSGSSLL